MWKPRLRRKPKATTVHTERDLWWVRIILNVGRPVVAVFVLVMCAPGEHYLARQAGWSDWLAWGMPATLTAYAGIAAVVATKRPKGAPGKATAVWGAIVSVLLAMAAQPVAHLYGRAGLSTQQVVLTVIVSCIPALVFGHLLHMAAAPVSTAPAEARIVDDLRASGWAAWNRSQLTDDDVDPLEPPQDEPGLDAMQYRAGDEDRVGMDADLSALRGTRLDVSGVPDNFNEDLRGVLDGLDLSPIPQPEGDMSPVTVTWPVSSVSSVSLDKDGDTDTPGQARDSVPAPVSRPVPVSRANGAGTSVTGRVRAILRDTPDVTDDEIRDTFTGEDIRPNTINKAIKRVRNP